MIKIKVFSIKQILYKMIYVVTILGLLIFCIIWFCIAFVLIGEKISKNDIDEFNMLAYETFSKEIFLEDILKSELPIFGALDAEDVSEINEQLEENKEAEGLLLNENMDIEIYEVSDKKYVIPEKYDVELYSNGKVRVGNTRITNYSNIDLNLEELSKPSQIEIAANSRFLIFHTHATESYTVPGNNNIVNYRTTDKTYNMISVGKKLSNSLVGRGFSVVHDEYLHDSPSYNGAYRSSLATVQNYLKTDSYNFILDIHRDALSSNLGFRPTAEIEGKTAAKLMFVIGTNGAGSDHENWMENLRLALMIQNRANEMYPGLFRDLHLSNSRFNQHVSPGAFIIEVGATGNTLEEAQVSMEFLANVLESFTT